MGYVLTLLSSNATPLIPSGEQKGGQPVHGDDTTDPVANKATHAPLPAPREPQLGTDAGGKVDGTDNPSSSPPPMDEAAIKRQPPGRGRDARGPDKGGVCVNPTLIQRDSTDSIGETERMGARTQGYYHRSSCK